MREFCGHGRRRAIVINVSDLTETLRNVPIPIVLYPGRIDYRHTEPDGADLRFVSADCSLSLPYEIENWNPKGTSVVWIRVPELNPDTKSLRLWLYHDRPGAAPGSAPGKVWLNDFVSVHHLAHDYRDSTSAEHHGEPTEPPPAATSGPLGPAFAFDGDAAYITLPDEGAYDFETQMSASIWFRVEEFDTEWQALLTKGDYAWRLHRYRNERHLSFGTYYEVHADFPGSSDVEDGSWHHALISYDGMHVRLFVDGVMEADEPYMEPLNNSDAPVMIGENSDHPGRHFAGALDEVRIANVPRSPDWALVEYRAVMDDEFVTFGPEEILDTCDIQP